VGKRTSQHANAEEVVGLSLLLLPFFFVTFALVSTAVSPTIFCLLPFPLAHLFRSFGTPPAISFFFFFLSLVYPLYPFQPTWESAIKKKKKSSVIVVSCLTASFLW
jgi:hypothetical protein